MEKIEIDCQEPGAGPVNGSATASPVAELGRLIEEEITLSEAYQTEIVRIADELRAQLPPECRGLLGSDKDESIAVLRSLEKRMSGSAKLQTP